MSLQGRFSIVDGAEEELKLQSAKGQALVALLCCSPDMKRTRVWLQDMLWSDREHEQASGSLRQTLSQLKKSLNVNGDLLLADRNCVWLDEDRIRVSDTDSGSDVQFLEGLNVRDKAFSAWLEDQRIKHGGVAAHPLPVGQGLMSIQRPANETLIVSTFSGSDEIDHVVSQVVAGKIAQNLRETLGIEVLIDQPGDEGRSAGLAIKVGVASKDESRLVHCQCAKLADGQIFWSGSRTVSSSDLLPQSDDNLSQLVNEVTLATCTMLARAGQSAGAKSSISVISEAVRQIFSMDKEQHVLADRALEGISEGSLTGIGLSWRVILRVVMSMERMATDPDKLRDEILEFSRKAEENDPLNSIVLASNAYASLMMFDDVARCVELGQKSTEINASNPFGWLARSFAGIRSDNFEEASQYMARAQMLERISPHRYWWDCMFAISATANSKYTLALNTFERVHAQSPNFKPPLRYMMSLHAANGDHKQANEVLAKLQTAEPDFSVQRLISDEKYPAHILRHTGLTNRISKDDLG